MSHCIFRFVFALVSWCSHFGFPLSLTSQLYDFGRLYFGIVFFLPFALSLSLSPSLQTYTCDGWMIRACIYIHGWRTGVKIAPWDINVVNHDIVKTVIFSTKIARLDSSG